MSEGKTFREKCPDPQRLGILSEFLFYNAQSTLSDCYNITFHRD